MFARLVLSYLGTGFLPYAPGTWGTAAAAATAGLLLQFQGVRDHWLAVSLGWVALATALVVLLTPGLEASGARKDPQLVVMDEVAGYWLVLAPLQKPDLTHLAAAFFLFRLFDVVKPWPGRGLENLPQGWGVALDDLAAAVYAGALLWGAIWIARNAV